jgi:DNA-directed RNA polymerase subunit RPC12/RpoP
MYPIRTALIALILCAPIASAADYMPLKEGNQWTYTMSNGMEITTKVVGFEDVGGVRCAAIDSTVAGQTSREYMAVDVQGVKSYMSQMQGQQFRYDPPVLRVKLPYRQGDTWQATVSQMGMSMNTTFESAGKERIQTPVGAFDCVKVQSSMDVGGQSMAATIWYADGIGPVHQIMQMSGQEITITLASTNVKPAPVPAPVVTAPVQEPRVTPTTQAAAQIRCPKCGTKVQPGAKFCPECGTKIEPPKPAVPTNCPKCGTKLPAGAKFCPACGERITATVPAPQPEPMPQPAPADGLAMEKYQSADGRVVLYKPTGWQVTEGDMFGQGIYSVVVMEPQENVPCESRDQGFRRPGGQVHRSVA